MLQDNELNYLHGYILGSLSACVVSFGEVSLLASEGICEVSSSSVALVRDLTRRLVALARRVALLVRRALLDPRVQVDRRRRDSSQ